MHVFLLSSSAHESAFQRIIEELIEMEDVDMLSYISARVLHIAKHGGHPDGNIAKRLSGVDMCEIRSKYHHGELLRIYYYVDKDQRKMLLLNCIIKPDGSNRASMYEGGARKRIEKEIQASIDIAVTLKQQYPPTHPAYEPFPL